MKRWQLAHSQQKQENTVRHIRAELELSGEDQGFMGWLISNNENQVCLHYRPGKVEKLTSHTSAIQAEGHHKRERGVEGRYNKKTRGKNYNKPQTLTIPLKIKTGVEVTNCIHEFCFFFTNLAHQTESFRGGLL